MSLARRFRVITRADAFFREEPEPWQSNSPYRTSPPFDNNFTYKPSCRLRLPIARHLHRGSRARVHLILEIPWRCDSFFSHWLLGICRSISITISPTLTASPLRWHFAREIEFTTYSCSNRCQIHSRQLQRRFPLLHWASIHTYSCCHISPDDDDSRKYWSWGLPRGERSREFTVCSTYVIMACSTSWDATCSSRSVQQWSSHVFN